MKRPARSFSIRFVLAPAGVLLIVLLGACNGDGQAKSSNREPKRIGFVLSDFELFYRPPTGPTDCPDGYVHTNRDNWEAQYPTQAARQLHLNRCGSIQNRGPNCENVWLNPEVGKDPLPFRQPIGGVAYGVNLDGTLDGRATDRTCAHQKFINPDGEAVDNQLYRFFGCDKQAHDPQEKRWNNLRQYLVLRVLLEISDIDDQLNDQQVEVALYRGRDPLVVDAAGKPVPWQSQRIDDGALRVIYKAHGKIIDGLLTTAPADVMWFGLRGVDRSVLIRDMTLRLKLTPTGAVGIRAGYFHLEYLWQTYSKSAVAIAEGIFGASGPSAYAALHRLADGHKNPTTGACTSLSSAEKLEFVRAHLVHPHKGEANR